MPVFLCALGPRYGRTELPFPSGETNFVEQFVKVCIDGRELRNVPGRVRVSSWIVMSIPGRYFAQVRPLACSDLGLGTRRDDTSLRAMWPLLLDLCIIGAYFAIIVMIGVHFSRRSKNLSEFSLGGRSIP